MNQRLKTEIKNLSPWYQTMKLNGIPTATKREDSEKIWKRIKSCLPENYKPKRILDLGCNAGYYSIMAAKLGASVVGIESHELPYQQSLFLKKYYEKLNKTQLDIEYIHKDICDINFQKLGKFDCIFALSVFYHIGNKKYGKGTEKSFSEQDRVISTLVKKTDRFIVRARQRKRTSGEYYNDKYYDKIFKSYGFVPTNNIPEKGERIMISYERK